MSEPCNYCVHKDDTEDNGCDLHINNSKCNKYAWYWQGITDERKKLLDEVYAIALNETHDTLIEWLQNNIQD